MYVDCEYCDENNICSNCNRCEIDNYWEMVSNKEIEYNPIDYILVCLTGNFTIKPK